MTTLVHDHFKQFDNVELRSTSEGVQSISEEFANQLEKHK